MPLLAMARIAADEFCSLMQIQQHFIGNVGSKELTDMLDFRARDFKWISPAGIDLTELCNRSSVGGFASTQWTTKGWILNARSMADLREEFPWFFEEEEDDEEEGRRRWRSHGSRL